MDVDLKGTLPMNPLHFDDYLMANDAACAPSSHSAYTSIQSYRSQPQWEKRKLLYLIQSSSVPDLKLTWEQMNTVGRTMPEGMTQDCGFRPPFAHHISTGARSERQKDTIRPFYQQSAPWACMVSHVDRYVRTFLHGVSTSLMGKSLKDRREDLRSLSEFYRSDCTTLFISDDKKKYSPHMDPESQQLVSDFLALISGQDACKVVTNVMFHSPLVYRVKGHMVMYDANGTDREGLRGAQNTWLEICTQAYCTRRLREAGVLSAPTGFAAFIDDALRCIPIKTQDKEPYTATAMRVIKEIEFSLKVIGRELSWDKAYVSHVLCTMLNETYLQGHPYSGGLKSFITMHDHEGTLVDNMVSLEADFFSKGQGAQGSGTPTWLAHLMYLFETIHQQLRFGIVINKQGYLTPEEHLVWCITPVALGGAGLRSQLQMISTETGNSVAGGMGNLVHFMLANRGIKQQVNNVINGSLERLSPIDFLRDPTQFHVRGPRLRSQRVAIAVRHKLPEFVGNPRLSHLLSSVKLAESKVLIHAKALQDSGSVAAVEIREYYRATPLKEMDDLVTKIVTSDSAKAFIKGNQLIHLRRQVRDDAVMCARAFRYRCRGVRIPEV